MYVHDVVTADDATVCMIDAIDGRGEADARLHAAAPLMLEALKTALVELKTLVSLDIRSNTAITNATTDMRITIVRAAIRAATGEDA